jgi:aryl-alcohol dehydrogenase-like predicted oxidoreductase
LVNNKIAKVKRISLNLLAWCLKNDNVHCVLLGASTAEQLYENINSLNVKKKCLIFILFKNINI